LTPWHDQLREPEQVVPYSSMLAGSLEAYFPFLVF